MHRTVLRTGTAALAVAMLAAGTATLPGASGAMATSRGPKVVEVTTDTPLAELPSSGLPRNPGAPVNPGPHEVRQPDGTRITVTAWGDSRTTGYQTRGGYAVTKDAAGVWRYAVRLDPSGRPVPSAREVGEAEPPAAARDLRAKVTAKSARAAARGQQGPGHGHRITARPGHPRLVRQPGQRGHHRGPVVTGLLRGRQLGVRLLPGQQLREVRPGAGRRERRGAEQRRRRLAAAPLRPPELRPRLRHRRDQARGRRRQGRRPLRRLRVLRRQRRRPAQRLRAARHRDRGRLRDVVRR